MFIADQDLASFRRWTSLNRTFWRPYAVPRAGADNGKVIYVDLFHNNIDYCIRNLLTARLLSLKLRRPLVALTGQVGIVPTACPSASASLLSELAESFGASLKVIEPETDTAGFRALLEQGLAEAGLDAQALTASTLRAFLTDWRLNDDFAIGRLVYETVLRTHLIETVETIDARLIEAGAGVVALRAAFETMFSTGVPAALITGHIDYSPYALLAEACLERGAGCIYVRNEGLMRLYVLYGRLKPGQTLLGRLREQSTKWQMRQQAEMISANQPGIELHSERVATSRFYRSAQAVNAPCSLPSPAVRVLARAAILARLGLDPT